MEALAAVRRLLTIILLVGAFLGGYYLGHCEGSPDIFAWARNNYPRFAAAGQEFLDDVRDGLDSGSDCR